MAHFAYVQGGIVQRVHVLANPVITDENGTEVEALGQAFLADLHGGDPADYIQCSYNASMRGAYPGPGFTYDPVSDVFVPPAAPAE